MPRFVRGSQHSTYIVRSVRHGSKRMSGVLVITGKSTQRKTKHDVVDSNGKRSDDAYVTYETRDGRASRSRDDAHSTETFEL